MSTANDMLKQRSLWTAFIAGSVLYMIFMEIALRNPAYANFQWHLTCAIGGNCSGAGDIGAARPSVNWMARQFIALNPGLWFGIAFSFLYAPRLVSVGFPPFFIGSLGIFGLLIRRIFYLGDTGFQFSAGLIVSAPYAVVGALIGFALHRLAMRVLTK